MALGVFAILFFAPIIGMAIFAPNGLGLAPELTLIVICVLAIYGILYTYRGMGDRYIPLFYRYTLQLHYCPHCDYPVVGNLASICSNCGQSLALESTP